MPAASYLLIASNIRSSFASHPSCLMCGHQPPIILATMANFQQNWQHHSILLWFCSLASFQWSHHMLPRKIDCSGLWGLAWVKLHSTSTVKRQAKHRVIMKIMFTSLLW